MMRHGHKGHRTTSRKLGVSSARQAFSLGA
jgi:hypothetical protein